MTKYIYITVYSKQNKSAGNLKFEISAEQLNDNTIAMKLDSDITPRIKLLPYMVNFKSLRNIPLPCKEKDLKVKRLSSEVYFYTQAHIAAVLSLRIKY